MEVRVFFGQVQCMDDNRNGGGRWYICFYDRDDNIYKHFKVLRCIVLPWAWQSIWYLNPLLAIQKCKKNEKTKQNVNRVNKAISCGFRHGFILFLLYLNCVHFLIHSNIVNDAYSHIFIDSSLKKCDISSVHLWLKHTWKGLFTPGHLMCYYWSYCYPIC